MKPMTQKVDLTRPIIPVTPPSTGVRESNKTQGQDFRQILEQSLNTKEGKLQFSKHASERLRQRQLEITPERLARVEEGIEAAAKKGCRESLVLLDEMALIVNVKNQIVVTAVDGNSLKNNLFTNIDSAIIV